MAWISPTLVEVMKCKSVKDYTKLYRLYNLQFLNEKFITHILNFHGFHEFAFVADNKKQAI